MDKSRCRREAHLQPSLAGGQSQPQSNVRLASPRWSQGDDVLSAIYVVTTCQIHRQRLVQAGHDPEVKTIQALRAGGLRRFDASLNHTTFAVDQLHLTQPRQILDVIFVLCSTELRLFYVLSLERWQAQLFKPAFPK